jgi:hypothetical protein
MVFIEFTYVVMLDLLIVAYTQFMMMMIELRKVLSQKLKCLYSMSTQFFWNEWYHNYGCESYIFIALEINILYRHVCIGYRMFIYCIYSTYIQVGMFTSGIVHNIQDEVRPLTPRKYTVIFAWRFFRNITLA